MQFFASAPGKKTLCLQGMIIGITYFDLDSKNFALGRYDLRGNPISLEKLWGEAAKRKSKAAIGSKPTAKHDDPLNVFAERNIKDK